MPIKRIQKGKAPTLLNPKKANEVIDQVNAVTNLQVIPANFGRFKIATDGAILDFTGLNTQIQQIIGAPPGASVSAPSGGVSALAQWRANFSITFVCNSDGTATIGWTP